jgi:hypothetical protein
MPDRDLPPDMTPDPIDAAYDRAEALTGDAAARAARRARVLAVVANEKTPLPVAARSARSRPARPYGGWLAAAGVAGLSLFLATQLYRPPQSPVTAPPTSATPAPAALPPISPVPAKPPPPIRPRPPAIVPLEAPPSPTLNIAPVEKPRPLVVPPQDPFSSPPPPAPAPSPPPPAPPPPPPPPPPAVALDERVEPQATGPAIAARGSPGQAFRLRAAAAAGRTAEVEALLAQGVPVDAPDAAGETALMKSIQAGHPAAAAALRRHGASLDRRNRAGESARDMATAKADPVLDQALDLGP